jgi:hypothetical protein
VDGGITARHASGRIYQPRPRRTWRKELASARGQAGGKRSGAPRGRPRLACVRRPLRPGVGLPLHRPVPNAPAPRRCRPRFGWSAARGTRRVRGLGRSSRATRIELAKNLIRHRYELNSLKTRFEIDSNRLKLDPILKLARFHEPSSSYSLRPVIFLWPAQSSRPAPTIFSPAAALANQQSRTRTPGNSCCMLVCSVNTGRRGPPPATSGPVGSFSL